MTKPLIQINDEIREMTDEEFAIHEIVQGSAQNSKIELEAKEQAKALAQAKLEALGLTVEDLTALGL